MRMAPFFAFCKNDPAHKKLIQKYIKTKNIFEYKRTLSKTISYYGHAFV